MSKDLKRIKKMNCNVVSRWLPLYNAVLRAVYFYIMRESC